MLVNTTCVDEKVNQDKSNSPFNMGDTASQASLVISQSSVRGLSVACMMVLEKNLVVRMGGANALALTIKAAAKERETICMVLRSMGIFRQ
jgi:hypothetical protein